MSETTHHALLQGRSVVLEGPDAVAASAAKAVAGVELSARRTHGTFTIALAGGRTPQLLYANLTANHFSPGLDWASWRVYFDDERAVAPDDPASNYRMAREALLDHVPILSEHVYRMRGESSELDAAAAEYSQLLDSTLPRASNGAPRFDCVLLGLGENGHTASLFPGTRALDVTDCWATRGRADYPPFDRITVTFPTINAAAVVMFLVTGPTKAEALRNVAAGTVPASRVCPADGSLLWFLDRDAAEGLDQHPAR
jgi:6-phosphogluconolactonase